jgi:hypothetical protein
MKRFVVLPASGAPIDVDAPNEIVALGLALDRLGAADSLARLACERLPNGTFIAKDLRGGARYVIQPALDDDQPVTLDPEAEAQEPDGFASWLSDIDQAASPSFAFQAALAAAEVAVPCDSASVLQLEALGLRFVAASGPIATQLVGRYIPADAGAAGFAVHHRQLMVLYDVGEDPRHFSQIDETTGYQTRNLCCAPVMFGDKVYGVIEVVNVPSGDTFNARAMSNLERVALRLAKRLAAGGPTVRARLSEPTVEWDGDEASYGDPVTLDDMALEPISVETIALALPAEEEG